MAHRDSRPVMPSTIAMPARLLNSPPAVWLGMLVVAELFMLNWLGSGRYSSTRVLETGWEWLLPAHLHSRYIVVGLGLLVLAFHFDANNRRFLLARRPSGILIAVHVAVVAAVLGLQQLMPPVQVSSPEDAIGLQWLYLPAVTLFVLAGVTGFLLFVPIHKLSSNDRRTILVRARRPVQGAVLLTLLLTGRYYHNSLNRSEIVRSFGSVIEGITLDLSLFFYSLPGFDQPAILSAENGYPILVQGSFAIQMAPSCAGYQGMMASIIVMLLVLTLDWRRLHLPRAVLLSILTVAMVFLMNAMRIAILLYIGIHVSEEIAIGGFHSYFGTLSLLVVVGITLVALQHPVFERASTDGAKDAHHPPLAEYADLAPLIMPLAIMLAVSFAVGTMQGDFNWLYGVATFVGAGLMWVVWDRIRAEMVGSPTVAGLACGVFVYVLWIALVPNDPERVSLFEHAFESVAPPVLVVWIAIRVMGSSIVVPVLEELAFRGGLQRLILRAGEAHFGHAAATVVAVSLSSLAFGLMHADVLAASFAGLAYGALAAWRGRIGDAIVAHAVTNFLIAMHVLALGEWSYW